MSVYVHPLCRACGHRHCKPRRHHILYLVCRCNCPKFVMDDDWRNLRKEA